MESGPFRVIKTKVNSSTNTWFIVGKDGINGIKAYSYNEEFANQICEALNGQSRINHTTEDKDLSEEL